MGRVLDRRRQPARGGRRRHRPRARPRPAPVLRPLGRVGRRSLCARASRASRRDAHPPVRLPRRPRRRRPRPRARVGAWTPDDLLRADALERTRQRDERDGAIAFVLDELECLRPSTTAASARTASRRARARARAAAQGRAARTPPGTPRTARPDAAAAADAADAAADAKDAAPAAADAKDAAPAAADAKDAAPATHHALAARLGAHVGLPCELIGSGVLFDEGDADVVLRARRDAPLADAYEAVAVTLGPGWTRATRASTRSTSRCSPAASRASPSTCRSARRARPHRRRGRDGALPRPDAPRGGVRGRGARAHARHLRRPRPPRPQGPPPRPPAGRRRHRPRDFTTAAAPTPARAATPRSSARCATCSAARRPVADLDALEVSRGEGAGRPTAPLRVVAHEIDLASRLTACTTRHLLDAVATRPRCRAPTPPSAAPPPPRGGATRRCCAARASARARRPPSPHAARRARAPRRPPLMDSLHVEEEERRAAPRAAARAAPSSCAARCAPTPTWRYGPAEGARCAAARRRRALRDRAARRARVAARARGARAHRDAPRRRRRPPCATSSRRPRRRRAQRPQPHRRRPLPLGPTRGSATRRPRLIARALCVCVWERVGSRLYTRAGEGTRAWRAEGGRRAGDPENKKGEEHVRGGDGAPRSPDPARPRARGPPPRKRAETPTSSPVSTRCATSYATKKVRVDASGTSRKTTAWTRHTTTRRATVSAIAHARALVRLTCHTPPPRRAGTLPPTRPSARPLRSKAALSYTAAYTTAVTEEESRPAHPRTTPPQRRAPHVVPSARAPSPSPRPSPQIGARSRARRRAGTSAPARRARRARRGERDVGGAARPRAPATAPARPAHATVRRSMCATSTATTSLPTPPLKARRCAGVSPSTT